MMDEAKFREAMAGILLGTALGDSLGSLVKPKEHNLSFKYLGATAHGGVRFVQQCLANKAHEHFG